MSIESAKIFLPKKPTLENVFQKVATAHKDLPKEPIFSEELGRATGDYLSAAIAYLANNGADPYMKEVGTTSWWMINQRRALTMVVNDMVQAAILLGVPKDQAAAYFSNQDEPYVLNAGRIVGGRLVTTSNVLMPLSFTSVAKENPIEALAMTAWTASQIRDAANGRMSIDPDLISNRAFATEAHFLIGAQSVMGDSFHVSEQYENIMNGFPSGIQSLPNEALYEGANFAPKNLM